MQREVTPWVLQAASFLYFLLGRGGVAGVLEVRTGTTDLAGGAGRLGIGTNSPRPYVENSKPATDALGAATEGAAGASDPEEPNELDEPHEPGEEVSESEFESDAELLVPLGRKSASWRSKAGEGIVAHRQLQVILTRHTALQTGWP